MKSLTYTVFGATDKGPTRETNEDFLLINENQNLFAVADGLGGLPMGQLASETAINALATMTYDDNFNFQDAFNKINDAVNAIGETIDSDFGIATTLTAIKIQDSMLYGGHIGDTGVFLFKKDSTLKLTQDHTMAEQIKADAPQGTIIPSYYHHILTDCIGKNYKQSIQTFQHPLQSGDRILLYSDGLTLTLTPQELHDFAFQSSTPQSFVNKILKESYSRHTTDNVTAIALFID